MLTTLRNSAQSWVIKVLLGMIVVTFVVSFGVGTFSNPKEVLVDVGGTELLVSDYLRQYQTELDRLRERFPDNVEALAEQLNLRQQVLDRMVNRQLMLQEAERQALTVTEAEVKEAVREQPAFQVAQRFDFNTYRQILAQNNLTPAGYEANLRDDLLLSKLQRNLIAGMIVGKPEIDQRYRIEQEQVEVEYVHVNPAGIRLSQQPTVEEVQAYYDAHPGEFTQSAQFKLRYFVLTLGVLEEDVDVRDRAVERYYERNVETEFSTPGRVRASHILKRLPQDAPADAAVKARAELEEVLKAARSGADFAKLAKEHSEDLSAQKGGDLGEFTRDDMVPAFSNAAFALPKGGISDIVRSEFGLHIIKVVDVKPGTRKSLDEVRDQIVAQLRTQRAERKLDLELERLPSRMSREGIEVVANTFAQPLEVTNFFDGRDTLERLGAAAPIYGQISNRRAGDVGVWRRNPVLGHVFYEVLERKDAFVKPLDAVKPQAVQAAANQNRRQQAITLAKETLEKLRQGQRLDAFAARNNLPVKTVAFSVVSRSIEEIGVNPEFQRAAFELSESNPYALNVKDEKAYLMRFKRRFIAEPAKEQELKAQITNQLTDAHRQYVLAGEIERLRAQTPVEVLAPEYVAANTAPAPRRAF